MRAEITPDRIMVDFEAPNVAGRACNGCTLCCKLVPVGSIQKRAGDRCQYQRASKGCSIYHRRPLDCRLWSCRWLVDPDTVKLKRPDHAHYVIDLELDELHFTDNESGKVSVFSAIQVWCDPAFPHAWRDPALRDYLTTAAAQQGLCTIIRFNNINAIAVFPPAVSQNGQWNERVLGAPNPNIGRFSRLPKHLQAPL